MKKLLFMLFVTAIVFAVGCQKEEVDLTNQVSSNEEELFEEQVVPIDIDVEVNNGALVFKNSEDFMSALKILDTVNLASRKAWEKSIGFNSLRTFLEESIKAYEVRNEDIQNPYQELLEYGQNTLELKDYFTATSSLLNLDGIFYMGQSVGSLRKDGDYWAINGDKHDLKQLIANKLIGESNDKLLYFDNGSNKIRTRACTTGDITIGEFCKNNGSKMGCGRFIYEKHFLINSLNPNFGSFVVFARMEGRSYKKNAFGNWVTDKSDHFFDFDFETSGRTPSDPHLFFSGGENHIDLLYAAIIIDVARIDLVPTGTGILQLPDAFILETVTSNTTHTTIEIPGLLNDFECS